MKKISLKMPTLALALGIAVAGCGGSYNSPPPPPPPAAVNFTTFVNDQFAATADDSDPVAVDETEFEFTDQDNPDAFSGLLESP